MNPDTESSGVSDREILCRLIEQVAKAVPEGKAETSVRTIVSRPMWDAWCKATGIPIGSNPTEWKGPVATYRIYGSQTEVVESDTMFAVSFPMK